MQKFVFVAAFLQVGHGIGFSYGICLIDWSVAPRAKIKHVIEAVEINLGIYHNHDIDAEERRTLRNAIKKHGQDEGGLL